MGRSTVSPQHADPKRSEGTRPKNKKLTINLIWKILKSYLTLHTCKAQGTNG
ncbi:MAG: hypothetical protein NZ455_15545 [Bacteroidia bacterium]|nr:hypothetical protein [Bacteroidia bacterium]MDW8346348.1 hypothetical protein [Bacteroidia bacterium]